MKTKPVTAALAAYLCMLPSVLTLVACGTTPPASPPVDTDRKQQTSDRAPKKQDSPTADIEFERRHRQLAEQLSQAGRVAEAADHWEVLAMLRPENAEYARGLTDARTSAKRQVTERVSVAADARERGDRQKASLYYLKALIADPSNIEAARALREIEMAQLDRSDRNRVVVVQRRTPGASSASLQDSAELESATMLMHQSAFSDSVSILLGYLKRYPHDELARQTLRSAYVGLADQLDDRGKREDSLGHLQKAAAIKTLGGGDLSSRIRSMQMQLAQDYYDKGVRLQRTDLEGAIVAWQQALQYDPGHKQAKMRLDDARRLQEALQQVTGKR